ncbi:DUF2726 domain-containing protein [Kingella sp. (in: b-proteobacteria)]|uniref:DUF2726 domain-containing protein n=1 Tax=Kingella sp. (in: b-proteobacteria) TaxID=2020713 RepID=UPI0026DD3453|nr:DUF2726 domain-containing protein [Kingella sp. (in: b-proteobacteria)]MDO4657964.1 DUF2726 domain-containing protein [Kingella sp. (in: b-proteobacteria)]
MNASFVLTVAILLLIFVALPILLLRRRNRNPFLAKNPKLPYLRRPLMTATEMDVYITLLEALPDYMVFSQVQASRVLEVPKSRETYYWFNFVSRLSYDFVICRADSTPIAVIEVDDRTHELPERQEADNRKNKATEAAGVAVIRWLVGETPRHEAIAKLIRRIDRKSG